MTIRKNVWQLGGLWADEVLWYARGVQAMQKRALADRTSWRFYAGIHGFSRDLWTQMGYLSGTDQLPSASDRATFWDQCQHGSWYFLPWHRGYVLALETMVRKAIADLGGPSEDWALPYWNYFGAGEAALPAEFATPRWPDGPDDNPLFVVPRYGPNGNGNVFVPMSQVNLNALATANFTGVTSGGGPGFGGIDTGFSHGGQLHGDLESQPHDLVHVFVGGRRGGDPARPGAMSRPPSAGLDPIFWLHHANIDRLWETWRVMTRAHTDPTDPDWLGGPAAQGDRGFVMPRPDGSPWPYTPQDMISTQALGYEYDDLAPAGAPEDMIAAASAGPPDGAGGDDAVAPEHRPEVEMIGASEPGLPLRAGPTATVVPLEADRLRRSVTLMSADAAPAVPERVLLNLENVRGTTDATVVSVYVGLPDGADPQAHPELLAGSIGLFGLTEASDASGEHSGEGITYVLDISEVVRNADLDDAVAAGQVRVTLVPFRPGDADPGDVPHEVAFAALEPGDVDRSDVDPDVTIGRVSVFREGG